MKNLINKTLLLSACILLVSGTAPSSAATDSQYGAEVSPSIVYCSPLSSVYTDNVGSVSDPSCGLNCMPYGAFHRVCDPLKPIRWR